MVPLVLILASRLMGDALPPPKIRIDPKYIPMDEYMEIDYPPIETLVTTRQFNDNYQSLTVPSNVARLTIMCNASYPIQWDFTYDNWDYRKRFTIDKLVHSIRKAKDMFDKSTYEYIQELTLNGVENTNSGNYTCRGTDDPDLVAAVFVFWAGNSPPYLIHSGKNKTVYRRTMDILILPCHVSVPDVKVVLQKQQTTNEGWENFDMGQIDSNYEPETGFTIRSPNSDFVGHFKCIVDGGDDMDYVLINVDPGFAPPPEESHEILENNATFSYNETTHTFTCCSDNWKRPNLQLLHCEHPTLCFVRKQTLGPIKNTGNRVAGQSCTIETLHYESSGLIRCKGSGVQIDREYFFPHTNIGQVLKTVKIRRNKTRKIWANLLVGKPFYRWSTPKDNDLIEIGTLANEIFVGQIAIFYCDVSSYYFAEGAKWSITWNNRSRLVQNVEGSAQITVQRRSIFRSGLSTMGVQIDVNMTSVICSIPVWNSSRWMEQTLGLLIQTPTIPKVKLDGVTGKGTNLVEVNWFLNDTKKVLNCTVIDGRPFPVISWTHDGKKINGTKADQNTSSLVIDVVHLSSHGEYICSVSNVAGVSIKRFHVTIVERNGSKLAAYMTGGIVLAILFVVGLGLLVKRLKTQAATINHLKTVAFKDVINRDHQSNGNGYGFNYPSAPPSIVATISVDHQFHLGQEETGDTVAVIDSHLEQETGDKSLNNFPFNGGYHKF